MRPASIVNLWTSRLRLYARHYSRARLAAARWLVRLGMRLKIRRARHDPALTDEQRDVLIEAYRVVIGLYR